MQADAARFAYAGRAVPCPAAYNADLPAAENSMKPFGTPHSDHALRVLLLGAGELGKEVAIELQRYAVEVIAVDRYANAPAMQIAHRSHVIDMLDGKALRAVIELEKPDLVVPEIEAIHTPTLIELEGGPAGDPDRPRGVADDGPRRHPQTGCRGAETADLAVSLLRQRSAVPQCGGRDRLPVRDQAGDEFIRQGSERGAQ
jgi:hypothetical protein